MSKAYNYNVKSFTNNPTVSKLDMTVHSNSSSSFDDIN